MSGARLRNQEDLAFGVERPWRRFVIGALMERSTFGEDPGGIGWTVQVIAWAIRHPEQALWWHEELAKRQRMLAEGDGVLDTLDEDNEAALSRLAERWRIEPEWTGDEE